MMSLGVNSRGGSTTTQGHGSQFGEVGSTEVGRTGAASSSSEESGTPESESSTYWERKG